MFFETNKLYGFDFLSKQLDLNDFKFSSVILKKKLNKYFNGNPMRLEARYLDESGKVKGVLWSLEVVNVES